MWNAFNEWPEPAAMMDLFLHSSGNSQTIHGDGKLSTELTPNETKVR